MFRRVMILVALVLPATVGLVCGKALAWTGAPVIDFCNLKENSTKLAGKEFVTTAIFSTDYQENSKLFDKRCPALKVDPYFDRSKVVDPSLSDFLNQLNESRARRQWKNVEITMTSAFVPDLALNGHLAVRMLKVTSFKVLDYVDWSADSIR